MPSANLPIYFIGLGSVFADATSTLLLLQYPYEHYEQNVAYNGFTEAGVVLLCQAAVLKVGDKLKLDRKITEAVALLPVAFPLFAAANNIALVAIAHAKRYPWPECPILYPE